MEQRNKKASVFVLPRDFLTLAFFRSPYSGGERWPLISLVRVWPMGARWSCFAHRHNALLFTFWSTEMKAKCLLKR